MNKRVHMFISGRVQGVGFRLHASDHAEELNLTGWARNLHDGRVEIVAEGEEAGVDAFCEWCRIGPSSADVSGISASFSEPKGDFESFAIRY